jgi:hypothetical protein
MGLPQRDPEYHTYGDYLAWPEAVRYGEAGKPEYGRPHTQELCGETPVGVLDGVVIQRDELAARLPQPEY